MLAPLALTFITAGATLGVIALLRREEERGVRLFERVRTRLDRFAARLEGWLHERLPQLDNQFLRQLFHYITNRTLSLLLRVTKYIETFILRAIRFNKQKAKKVQLLRPQNSHLGEIAAYKKESSLSEEEKQSRREVALNGE